MVKTEHRIQDEIRKEVSSKCKGIVLRTNAGKVYAGEKIWSSVHSAYILKNPRPVSLLPAGFPDLLYLGPGATAIFIEVKNDRGRVRESQKRFHALLRKFGFRVCIARSAEEAVNFINGGPTPND